MLTNRFQSIDSDWKQRKFCKVCQAIKKGSVMSWIFTSTSKWWSLTNSTFRLHFSNYLLFCFLALTGFKNRSKKPRKIQNRSLKWICSPRVKWLADYTTIVVSVCNKAMKCLVSNFVLSVLCVRYWNSKLASDCVESETEKKFESFSLKVLGSMVLLTKIAFINRSNLTFTRIGSPKPEARQSSTRFLCFEIFGIKWQILYIVTRPKMSLYPDYLL